MNLIHVSMIQVLQLKTAIIRSLRQIQIPIQIKGPLSKIISTKIIGYTTDDAVQLAGNHGHLQQAYMNKNILKHQYLNVNHLIYQKSRLFNTIQYI